jgi:RNA polymerase sigma factor (sigma-70 family)
VKLTDKEILTKIACGNDKDVLIYLYKVVYPSVRTIILRNSGKEDDAKDMFQEAVMVFYKYVKQEKFNSSFQISAFICSVSKKMWISCLRKQNKMVLVEEFDDDRIEEKTVLNNLISKEKELLIGDVFSKLGDTCKELLGYSIYQKFSMKEICEKMGFANENTAKTKNYKCKQRLIDLLKNYPSIKTFLKE